MNPVLGIPLKALDTAKGRLATRLDQAQRVRLIRDIAARAVNSARSARFDVIVVSDSTEVLEWAGSLGVRAIGEPEPGGLDAAAALVTSVGSPWCVLHGDLPLVTADDLEAVRSALVSGRNVIAPSRDGGSNAIGGSGPFRFSYGPGSFGRHLAAMAQEPPLIIVSAGLAVEIDTIADLRAVAHLDAGSWLDGYLR